MFNYKNHKCKLSAHPTEFTHVVQETNGKNEVAFVKKSLRDENQHQLDPQICSVSKMLESGITLKPTQISNIIESTPPSEELLNLQYEKLQEKIINKN